ncbi:MAG: hypothetical protein R6V49_06150, partial [Bacteroidales bacterium]
MAQEAINIKQFAYVLNPSDAEKYPRSSLAFMVFAQDLGCSGRDAYSSDFPPIRSDFITGNIFLAWIYEEYNRLAYMSHIDHFPGSSQRYRE